MLTYLQLKRCLISLSEIIHHGIDMAGNLEVDHILKCSLYRGSGRAAEKVSQLPQGH